MSKSIIALVFVLPLFVSCVSEVAKNENMNEIDMEKAEFFVTTGYGERQLKMHGYSQAVKIGNRIETSGQGGRDNNWEFPENLNDEIAQAFDNLTRTQNSHIVASRIHTPNISY